MRSLGARKITEPDAMDRYTAAAAEYDRVVAKAEKLASGDYDRLGDAQIAYLADLFARDQAEWVERRRLDPDAADFAERALNGIWWHEDDYLRWRVENDLEEMVRLVDLFRPLECASYFSSCGYDPD